MQTESHVNMNGIWCPAQFQSIRRWHVRGSFRLVLGIFPEMKEKPNAL